MTRSIQRRLVLYVLPRGKRKEQRAICIDFAATGRVKRISATVPLDCQAPWLAVQRKEWNRLCEVYDLRPDPVERVLLTPEEREKHKRQAEAKYRNHIELKRQNLGLPLRPVPQGQRAPDEDVARVLQLLGTVDPDTGKVLSGVKIAIMTQRSASFVSRVKNGTRRQLKQGE